MKARHDQPLPAEEMTETVLAEEKGAPCNRAEVLAAARELLELAITAGLSHIGVASAERFATLAVSADGTNLPRLARLLNTAADELGLLAIKHGRVDTEAPVDALASTYALVAALEKDPQQPPANLVGEHRASYVEVRALDRKRPGGL